MRILTTYRVPRQLYYRQQRTSLVLITPGTPQLQVEATPDWLCIMKSREERRELMNRHNVATHITEILQFEPAASLNEKWDSLDETLQQSLPLNDPTYELPTQIEGSDKLRSRIQRLLEKYRECFRRTVAKTPADVPPMELDVDVEKWETSRQSKAPLRQKSGRKDVETRRQCLGMLELDVIEPRVASSWSQVHLAPKPEGAWRFTLDFRFLNECTRSRGGVIPNIKKI